MKKAPTETGGRRQRGQRGAFLCGRGRPPPASGIPIRLGHLASFGRASETPASHMFDLGQIRPPQFVVAGSMDLEVTSMRAFVGLRKGFVFSISRNECAVGVVQIEHQRL